MIDERRLSKIAAKITALSAGAAKETGQGETGAEDVAGKGEALLTRIEAELERLEAHELEREGANRALFARGPVVVFRWRNCEGWPVEFVSPNVEQLTGYPREEFASDRLPYASLIVEEDLAQVFAEVAEHSASSQWFEHEPYRIRRHDGELLWIYDYTVVLRDEQGAATHFYGYIMDITERVQTEAKMREQLRLIEDLELPLLQIWEGVLAVPLVGMLTDTRAERITQTLLERVGEGHSRAVIIDFTGIDLVDTLTAVHLSKMIQAVRLLGSECVLSGVSPTVARTMVELGIDFGELLIARTLAAALREVLAHR